MFRTSKPNQGSHGNNMHTPSTCPVRMNEQPTTPHQCYCGNISINNLEPLHHNDGIHTSIIFSRVYQSLVSQIVHCARAFPAVVDLVFQIIIKFAPTMLLFFRSAKKFLSNSKTISPHTLIYREPIINRLTIVSFVTISSHTIKYYGDDCCSTFQSK